MSIDLPVVDGPLRITLEVDGCVSPKELGRGNDGRCLGLQVAGPPLERVELYDLVRDPLAQDDLFRGSPDLTREIGDQLSLLRWTPRVQAARQQLSDEEAEALKALGYLDRD